MSDPRPQEHTKCPQVVLWPLSPAALQLRLLPAKRNGTIRHQFMPCRGPGVHWSWGSHAEQVHCARCHVYTCAAANMLRAQHSAARAHHRER
eukprot:8982857-Alexandrium_andersonii.AAC.1